MDSSPSPAVGCSEGHRGANRYFIIIPFLALLILICPLLTCHPSDWTCTKKLIFYLTTTRRKDDSCMYKYESHCLKFATYPAKSWFYTQSPLAPGQWKRCKKTSVVETKSLLCYRLPLPCWVTFLSFFPWKGPKHEKFMVGIFKQIRPVWIGKIINLAKNFKN